MLSAGWLEEEGAAVELLPFEPYKTIQDRLLSTNMPEKEMAADNKADKKHATVDGSLVWNSMNPMSGYIIPKLYYARLNLFLA